MKKQFKRPLKEGCNSSSSPNELHERMANLLVMIAREMLRRIVLKPGSVSDRYQQRFYRAIRPHKSWLVQEDQEIADLISKTNL